MATLVTMIKHNFSACSQVQCFDIGTLCKSRLGYNMHHSTGDPIAVSNQVPSRFQNINKEPKRVLIVLNCALSRSRESEAANVGFKVTVFTYTMRRFSCPLVLVLQPTIVSTRCVTGVFFPCKNAWYFR